MKKKLVLSLVFLAVGTAKPVGLVRKATGLVKRARLVNVTVDQGLKGQVVVNKIAKMARDRSEVILPGKTEELNFNVPWLDKSNPEQGLIISTPAFMLVLKNTGQYVIEEHKVNNKKQPRTGRVVGGFCAIASGTEHFSIRVDARGNVIKQ